MSICCLAPFSTLILTLYHDGRYVLWLHVEVTGVPEETHRPYLIVLGNTKIKRRFQGFVQIQT